MKQYKVVFDGIEAKVRESTIPAIQKLTFSLTFQADSREHAEFIMRSIPESDRLGVWHIEEVEVVPDWNDLLDDSRPMRPDEQP